MPNTTPGATDSGAGPAERPADRPDLPAADGDLANLFNCIDIPLVFLDAGLCVKRFTPAAARLFGLDPTDTGRPVGDVAGTFAADLLRDAEQVVRDSEPREREVRAGTGRWFTRRIVPYRAPDGRTDGVVVTCVDVTERKRTADAAARRLAAIVEGTADAIFSKDLAGTVQTWNAGAERLFGYAADEIVGRSIRPTIPVDRVGEWAAAMTRLARGEHVEQMETERVRKDGRRVPVVLTYSPIRDADGTVASVSAIARDVTDRARTEQALRESEQRFRLMADAAPVLIWLSGADKVCTWFNKSWLDFVGRPMERELGNGWVENVHPEDRDGCLDAYGVAFDARRPFRMEYRLRRHDGEYRWVLDTGAPLVVADSGFTGFVGSCIDITERKAAERAVLASEERLQAILKTAADAIITIDRGGIIQSINPAAERTFGYTAAEMVGRNVNALMPSPDREEHDAHILRYLRTGEPRVLGTSREVAARRKDGTVFPVDLAVSEIKHLELFTGIVRDVTRRKELEREVVEVASLEQRRIGQDLHDSVAQELTALNLLAGELAEALRTDRPGAARLVERLTRGVQRSQLELRAVLRGLLPVAVESEGLMAALADLADRTQREGRAACTFECPEPVAVADNLIATHLYLIAQEAVHNAVRHARPGCVRISLGADRRLVLCVRDDGTGMPRAPTEVQGLGLRIMSNRAAIIGATLSIEPARPTGTAVTCVLPRGTHERKTGEEAGPRPDRR
ncbi:MAG: PAS domain S-box protein [Planctomycetes bacterium]|nr:PAS domain S-box protein [Planctomycetota bacterium]